MKPFVAVLASLLVLVPSLAHAQGTSPTTRLTWRDVAERQKRENVTLLAGRHRLSQVRADVIAAGVWSNPNVNVNALLLTHDAVTGGKQEVAVSIDQVVPIAGQVGLRQDVARGFSTAEERAFAASAWQLASEARIAFVDLQRAQARVKLVEVGLADLARVEQVVSERAAGGAGTTYDKVRVGIERSKVEARLAQARVELVSARGALAALVGKSLDATSVAVEEGVPDTSTAPTNDEELVKRALAARPELASADLRLTASELRVSLSKRQVIPSPTLSLGYARYVDVPDQNGASGGALLAGLSLPVPLLDRGQGRIDRSIAEAAEQRVLKDGVALAIRRDVELAAATLRVRVEASKRFRDQTAPDLPRLRTIAELSYREGRATILELLDAYASHLDAEERRLDLQASAAKAALDLERALGPTR